MPTNRTKRQRKSSQLIVPKALKYYFETGDTDQSAFDKADRYNPFLHFVSKDSLKMINYWNICKSELLNDWTKKFPCTRPWAWWNTEAPRWDDPFIDCFYHGTLPEPRQRIGGTGTPNYEVLAYVPHFDKGLPTGWVSQFDEEYYNGRRRDVHGNIIPTEYKDGNFKGKAISPNDPPTFESEAAYLQRHRLLTVSEKKWLADHPEALEPEQIKIERLED